MTFIPLSILLGIIIGAGIVYIYFRKKTKGLIKGAQEFFDNNINKFPEAIQTLKSEGPDHRIDQPKKVEEVQKDRKEVPDKVPASTPIVPVEEIDEE